MGNPSCLLCLPRSPLEREMPTRVYLTPSQPAFPSLPGLICSAGFTSSLSSEELSEEKTLPGMGLPDPCLILIPSAPLPAPSKRPKDPPQPHGPAADPSTFPTPLLGGPGRLQSPPCVRDSCCSTAAPACEQRPRSSCASSESEAESSAHTNDNWHFRGWQEKLNPSARCPSQPWPR